MSFKFKFCIRTVLLDFTVTVVRVPYTNVAVALKLCFVLL